MPARPRRLSDHSASAELPLAAWLSGLALAMLVLGSYGALQPLLPAEAEVFAPQDDAISITDFPPPAAQAEETPEPPPELQPEIEIPPLPEVIPPLTPPEMTELTPEDKPPPPQAPKPEPKPKPKTSEKPRAQPQLHPAAPTSQNGGRAESNSGAQALFTGGGSGRFPQPTYPLGARSAHVQGSVRLLVVVEASGIPSSVEVTSSSGSHLLDSAARDCVSRRWRWPAGSVRRYVVPIRFEIH